MIAALKLDHHMREILRGTSVAMILRVLGAGLGFGYNIVLARLLGAQGAGIYYLALTVVSVGSVLGRLGLDQPLLRFTAASAIKEDWSCVTDIYRKGLCLSIGASLFVATVLYFSATEIAVRIFSEPELESPLRVMILGIPFLSLLTLHGQLFLGIKKVGTALFIRGTGVSIIGLPLILILAKTFGIKGAALAYVASLGLALVSGAWLWHRATPRVKRISSSFDIRQLIQTSLPLLWAAMMMYVLTWADTIMLGIWLESSSVGIYGVAYRTAGLASYFLLAIGSITSPKFAALYEQKDIQRLKQVAQGTSSLAIILSLPLVAVFILVPRTVLGMFGPAFEEGASVLVILSIGYFINTMGGLISYLLTMTGNQQSVSRIMTVVALLNIGLNYMLIRPLGILGAGIATTTCMIFSMVLFSLAAIKKLKFVPFTLPKLLTR